MGEATAAKGAAKARGRLIDQKGIQAEYGLKSRDVIRWSMSRDSGFPRPLRIIGRVYLFERAAIDRYFGL